MAGFIGDSVMLVVTFPGDQQVKVLQIGPYDKLCRWFRVGLFGH